MLAADRKKTAPAGDAVAESLGLREKRHTARIVESVGLARAAPVRRRRRRRAVHSRRRHLEHAVRVEVLAFRRWCLAQSVGVETIASLLHLGAATLAAWERSWRSHRLRPRPRGRPPRHADRDTRNHVIAAIHLLGPGVGIPMLRLLFPALARRSCTSSTPASPPA